MIHSQITSGSRTITVAELAPDRARDHVMPMFWGNPAPIYSSMMAMLARANGEVGPDMEPASVAKERHSGRANYVFADGHAAAHDFADTWQQPAGQPRLRDWYDPKRAKN